MILLCAGFYALLCRKKKMAHRCCLMKTLCCLPTQALFYHWSGPADQLVLQRIAAQASKCVHGPRRNLQCIDLWLCLYKPTCCSKCTATGQQVVKENLKRGKREGCILACLLPRCVCTLSHYHGTSMKLMKSEKGPLLIGILVSVLNSLGQYNSQTTRTVELSV